MVKTSHAALYSIAVMIASTSLSSVCGHSVDITQIDYWGMGLATMLGAFDWFKRHYGAQTPTTS